MPSGNHGNDSSFLICRCTHCAKFSVWIEGELVDPRSLSSPRPHTDLPEEIAVDFEEARKINHDSPRGSAALLRLCVQKLCVELGESGNNINDDASDLVKKGLPMEVQQALDIVRVVGNNSVHPGQIDLKDDAETTEKLFALVNLAIEVMIAQPKRVDELYKSIVPESTRTAIAKRAA